MTLSVCLGIVKYNSKILCKKQLLGALIYPILLPIVFSFTLLQPQEVARLSEVYFSLMGALILTGIAEVDFEDGVGEIISTKWRSKGQVFVYRLLIGLLLLAAVSGILMGFMLIQGSKFDFIPLFYGTLVNQLFLGLIGITFANLGRNAIVGYLVSFSYFFMEYSTKGKYTGSFYLFSLLKNDFAPKCWLLGVVLVLTISNAIFLHWRNVQ